MESARAVQPENYIIGVLTGLVVSLGSYLAGRMSMGKKIDRLTESMQEMNGRISKIEGRLNGSLK